MLTTVEGVYKNGRVELLEQPEGIEEARLLVTFLASKPEDAPEPMLRYGQFAGSRVTDDEDFKIAEWHGEPEFDDQYR